MNDSFHTLYIVGSFLAAAIAALGMMIESPAVYGFFPGVIGLTLMVIGTVRFFKHKTDLAGFIATVCGFIFYQAFQANPVTLREFEAGIAVVAPLDKTLGLFLGNFTTGMLLLSYRAISAVLGRQLGKFVPHPAAGSRRNVDPMVMVGFVVVFVVVALPNVLFGKVVVGAIKNIVYQRASWSVTGEFSGFETWGGPVSTSLLNLTFWSTSMFFLWLYLLGSRYRLTMFVLSPLVLLWSASVALQGSRTYLVILGFGLIVYYLGNPRFGGKIFTYGGVVCAVMLVLMQMATLFRTEGLASVNLKELAEHMFEIRGNEGTSSQMDGLEFFRTELLAKGAAPNPVVGFVRGLIERPIEGILMPLPRSLFPWKPLDVSATEFSVYFQNVRLGVPSTEAFLGASPGLMGRELIRYGILGPVTLLFWLGLILALADKLYTTGASSDFHRLFVTVLVTFFVAQMRDWVPMWFLPFLPAMLILGYVAWRARRFPRSARSAHSSRRSLRAGSSSVPGFAR